MWLIIDLDTQVVLILLQNLKTVIDYFETFLMTVLLKVVYQLGLVSTFLLCNKNIPGIALWFSSSYSALLSCLCFLTFFVRIVNKYIWYAILHLLTHFIYGFVEEFRHEICRFYSIYHDRFSDNSFSSTAVSSIMAKEIGLIKLKKDYQHDSTDKPINQNTLKSVSIKGMYAIQNLKSKLF